MNKQLNKWKSKIERRISALEKGNPSSPSSVTAVTDVKERTAKGTGKIQTVVGFLKRRKAFLEIVGTILALVTGVLSFFPHVVVSDPAQMDATDFFSYQLTITNDGILPIYRADWAFAPRLISMTPAIGHHNLTLLLPHYADWVATDALMASVVPDKPGSERRAAILMLPGAKAIVDGTPDYEFHVRPANNRIGTLSPGDQFTFTLEGLITAPVGATYDEADFAIAISYIPIFPPIRMQTCSHFHVYKDRQGTPHWFKSPNQCDRFPWMHNWFFKNAAPK